MDIPQEISEKIASYIRRPCRDEDIVVKTRISPERHMTLDEFKDISRRFGRDEENIQRVSRAIRKAWVTAGCKLLQL